MEGIQKGDTHATGGIPVPPCLQRLRPGPHCSLASQTLYLGPSGAIGNFLHEVILAGCTFPRSLLLCGPGILGPWEASIVRPVRLPQQPALYGFLDQRERNCDFWKHFSEIKKLRRWGCYASEKASCPTGRYQVSFLLSGDIKFIHSTNVM